MLGSLAWSAASGSLIRKLSTIQKAAVRHVGKKLFLAHTEPVYKKLKILMLDDLITLQRSTFMFKNSMGRLPSPFSAVFTPLANFSRSRCYLLPKTKGVKLQNSPTYTLINTWNKVHMAHKNIALLKNKHKNGTQIKHIEIFNSTLTKYLLDNYKSKLKCYSTYCKECR